jgi:mannose-1-phosphate guanylyltransferase
MKIIPIILTGGFGKRLWPLSRQSYPKQFLSLNSENTMFQETIIRLDKVTSVDVEQPIVICNQEHRFLVAEQIQQIGKDVGAILLEPLGRNTAPAVAAACHYIKTLDNNDNIILVLPADHQINDLHEFDLAISKAYSSASSGDLITFGVEPTEPHTGYGYIKKGSEHIDSDLHQVDEFVEKPDINKAEKFINSGAYLWNSGIFMFQVSTYLNALRDFSPEIYNMTKMAIDNMEQDHDFIRINEKFFGQSPSDSIDYAVMEKAISHNITINVASLDADWSDLGSWKSLWEKSSKDRNSNLIKGDVITEDSTSNLLYSKYGLIATAGIKDMIVVQTSDVVLVADKSKSESVSKIVDELLSRNREEPIFHRKVTRPWGTFDSIDETDSFKVKRLTVNPGAKLSLQMHHQREEFWVVVAGTASVTRGDDVLILKVGETIHIPIEMTHSLENPYDEPLIIIEVQIGSYLGEDDIVRFDDQYGRVKKD